MRANPTLYITLVWPDEIKIDFKGYRNNVVAMIMGTSAHSWYSSIKQSGNVCVWGNTGI